MFVQLAHQGLTRKPSPVLIDLGILPSGASFIVLNRLLLYLIIAHRVRIFLPLVNAL